MANASVNNSLTVNGTSVDGVDANERDDYEDSDAAAVATWSEPADVTVTLGRFLDYSSETSVSEVPDPYYGGEDGFDRVLDLIEGGAEGLLDALRERL